MNDRLREDIDEALAEAGPLPDEAREVEMLRCAILNGCRYCALGYHHEDARRDAEEIMRAREIDAVMPELRKMIAYQFLREGLWPGKP